MAWGAAATGHPGRHRVGRPGSLAHAGVALGDLPSPRTPGRGQHGPGAGRLLPGHQRGRSRRLPPHRAGAGGRSRGDSAGPSRRSISPTGGATRSLCLGDYYLAHVTEAVEVSSRGLRAAPCARTGPWTARPVGRLTPRMVSPIHVLEAKRPEPIDHGRYIMSHQAHLEELAPASTPRFESGFTEDCRTGGRRLRHPGSLRALRGVAAARPGPASRVRPADHAVAVPDRRGPSRRRSGNPGRRRLRAERRSDDRRRQPGRPGPGARWSHRRDELRRAPVSGSRPTSRWTSLQNGSSGRWTTSSGRRYDRAPGSFPRAARPRRPATVVEDFTPSLILSGRARAVPGVRRAGRHSFRPRDRQRARLHAAVPFP